MREKGLIPSSTSLSLGCSDYTDDGGFGFVWLLKRKFHWDATPFSLVVVSTDCCMCPQPKELVFKAEFEFKFKFSQFADFWLSKCYCNIGLSLLLNGVRV